MSEDKKYVGVRQTMLYSVDAKTGKVLNIYGSNAVCDASRSREPSELDEDDNDWDNVTTGRETFLLGRTGEFTQLSLREIVSNH